MRTRLFCLIAVGVTLQIPAFAAAVTFSASGPLITDIVSTVTNFRAALGTLNPNVAGSFGTGRREINWDGVADSLSAPNNLPANFFNSNSPRGVVFSTPGTGFQVSSNLGTGADQFGNIDPTYPTLFQPFSSPRLFTALGSTITDVNLFVPGSLTPAFTNGFGVVFSDVDSANATSLQFFDVNNSSLGTFFAPAATGNETFSFVGVVFNAGEQVGRVRVTSGSQILASGNTANDLVVMDDFIYGEPNATAAAVPEPASWLLAAAGTCVFVIRRRLRA